MSKMWINPIYISPYSLDLPDNIAVIEADTHEEALYFMHEAIMQAPVNCAVWYRDPESISPILEHAQNVANTHYFKTVYRSSKNTLSTEFNNLYKNLKSNALAAMVLTEEFQKTLDASYNLFQKQRLRVISTPTYTQPEINPHIDYFPNPSIRVVQPLTKPETMVFDNYSFPTMIMNKRGDNVIQVDRSYIPPSDTIINA